nr:hypothetical protein [Tanacetum cinerariifolium]
MWMIDWLSNGETDIVRPVVEIESFGKSSDEFDKETGSSGGLQSKQADLSCVHALKELHSHEIRVVLRITFNIIQNLQIIFNKVYRVSGYDVLLFDSSWFLVKCRHRYAVSSLMDTAYSLTLLEEPSDVVGSTYLADHMRVWFQHDLIAAKGFCNMMSHCRLEMAEKIV